MKKDVCLTGLGIMCVSLHLIFSTAVSLLSCKKNESGLGGVTDATAVGSRGGTGTSLQLGNSYSQVLTSPLLCSVQSNLCGFFISRVSYN